MSDDAKGRSVTVRFSGEELAALEGVRGEVSLGRFVKAAVLAAASGGVGKQELRGVARVLAASERPYAGEVVAGRFSPFASPSPSAERFRRG